MSPNSSAAIPRTVWGMLLLRPTLAIVSQGVFFAGFWAAAGSSGEAWRSSADYWLVSFALAEFVNLWLLMRVARAEGLRYRDLINVSRADVRGDLKWFALAFAGTAILSMVPNLALGFALWGDAQAGANLMFRGIAPPVAIAAIVVFPIIHALTELPTYIGYVQPRLQTLLGRRWTAILLVAAVLSLQHVFLPLLFDWRFVAWRALMFLPFALWLAWLLDRRPTVLPYMVVTHVFLDLSLPIMVLVASLA